MKRNVSPLEWEHKVNKNINLYKDKKFFIPFVYSSYYYIYNDIKSINFVFI